MTMSPLLPRLGNYLVHDGLVSKQFAYNMTVCKAGTLIVFTKYGLLVSSRDLKENGETI